MFAPQKTAIAVKNIAVVVIIIVVGGASPKRNAEHNRRGKAAGEGQVEQRVE